ncbi:MAG: 1,4-alpha-glucan branching protein domain-containing protein [Solirubrobacteraceae bacterium]
MAAGELAIVLHTHMPYVEGFGTWPFGEEWLWEAIATSYLPLLDVLDGFDGPPPLTLSVTPVLADQLEYRGTIERCRRFLEEIRPESHRRDIAELRARGEGAPAAELQRSAGEYALAARRLAELSDGQGPGLLAALGRHATWTSSATHAVLPLVATESGVELQLQTGIASHRRRFPGAWSGGFWLPECAHAPWLDPLLDGVGVRATCVELTALFGLGDRRHLRPLATADGPVLWPIDRATIALVWGDGGYPSAPAYRDHHHHTTHRHRAWRIDGAPYDRTAALHQARLDARDFVGRVRARVADGGVCVCALDTELLGHWWYEGVEWLRAVLEHAGRQGLGLTTLDDGLSQNEPVAAPELPVTSWGEGGDLRTWSGPDVAELAWQGRTAELGLAASPADGVSPRALRELLALQSSDWAFQAHRRLAGDYPLQRARGHADALAQALRRPTAADPALRGLAPDLTGWS